VKNKLAEHHWKDPVTLATIVIAVATVINLAASFYVSKKTSEYTEVTKNIYKSSNRPYIGIETMDSEADGTHMFFNIKFKNYGSVPANDVRITVSPKIDGVTYVGAGNDVYDSHLNLFPQTTRLIKFKQGPMYNQVMSGKAVFDLLITVKYKGIAQYSNDDYEDNEHWRFDPAHKSIWPIKANAK